MAEISATPANSATSANSDASPRAPRVASPSSHPRGRRAAWRLAALAGVLGMAALLGGCSTLAFYGQAVRGHLALMAAARPVSSWLHDPATPPALKARLELAEHIRSFAVTALDLSANASYHRYADLHRAAAVWNVAAAPADSLVLKRWCFLIAGCVAYRGYYNEDSAQAEAAKLRTRDQLEVAVYGVPAYSTLGWLNWLGGDPLLSTFIGYPEGELARLIFHELAHQKIYLSGATTFNESYATAVSRLGVHEWLAQRADATARREYALLDSRRRAFRALTSATRDALAAVYQKKPNESQTQLLAQKERVMGQFHANYAALKARWAADGEPFSGYDGWVASANNASFAMLAAYDEYAPAFEALFVREGRNWPRFYAAVRRLADLPLAAR